MFLPTINQVFIRFSLFVFRYSCFVIRMVDTDMWLFVIRMVDTDMWLFVIRMVTTDMWVVNN